MKKEYDFSKGTIHRKPLLDKTKTKVQTSVRIDADIFLWLQEESHENHIPYQTLMNKYLRETMEKPADKLSIEARVEALEKKIFKKAK